MIRRQDKGREETHRPYLCVGCEFEYDVVDGEEETLQVLELLWGDFE